MRPDGAFTSEGGASIEAGRDTAQFDTAPAGYRVRCRQSGGSSSHIQLCVAPFAVEAGRLYRLQYRARATAPFTTLGPRMMRSGKPWTSYASEPRVRPIRVTESWTTFTQYYLASITATDARLTFYLGRDLPPGATLHVDSLSLVPCRGKLLTRDVGNIIFDHEASCGVKVFEPEKVDAQGKYWYDENRCLLKLYSVKNPAEYYRDIECALNRHIISESNRSYVNYENLALRYGAAHGVGGGSTHHITVADCDISYIGGADQYGGERTVRFGNGIEFWGAAHDNLVQRCRIWEVYDAGVTNQSKGATVEHRNITYRNNLIWNCEFSFEYWNRPETSITRNVRFENNTCLNAGGGWGHTQRPDRGGRHLCFYSSPADARDNRHPQQHLLRRHEQRLLRPPVHGRGHGRAGDGPQLLVPAGGGDDLHEVGPLHGGPVCRLPEGDRPGRR